MKINIKKAMLTLLAVPVLAAGVAGLVAPHVGAAAASDNGLGLRKGVGSAKGNDQVSCLFGSEKEGCTEGSGIFQIIVNVILFIVGAVAVIMIVIGGVRYTVSMVTQMPYKVPKTPSCTPSLVLSLRSSHTRSSTSSSSISVPTKGNNTTTFLHWLSYTTLSQGGIFVKNIIVDARARNLVYSYYRDV